MRILPKEIQLSGLDDHQHPAIIRLANRETIIPEEWEFSTMYRTPEHLAGLYFKKELLGLVEFSIYEQITHIHFAETKVKEQHSSSERRFKGVGLHLMAYCCFQALRVAPESPLTCILN